LKELRQLKVEPFFNQDKPLRTKFHYLFSYLINGIKISILLPVTEY